MIVQLKVNDAALRVQVNVHALDLPSPPDSSLLASLQEHITKLQVKPLHIVRFLLMPGCKMLPLEIVVQHWVVRSLFTLILFFSKAVSGSLNFLINSAAQDKSADGTADPSTTSARLPPNSGAAESKAAAVAAADDVMVQITARKSEVGSGWRLRQLFLQSETFPSSPLLFTVKRMNNQK